MKPKIAFVGVGRMGSNMARCLHRRGYSVTALYDANPGLAARLADELGCSALPLETLTTAADVIFTVVSDDAAQRAIFSDPDDNLLKHGAKGKVFVNCATLSPAVHAEVGPLCAAAGGEYLEACMASSIPQALNGTLFMMCSGAVSAFEQVTPVLAELSDGGKLLRYIGPAGSASQLKAIVNMVMNINTAGLAEGLGLAAALGLDLRVVLDVLGQTGAASRVLVTDGEDMVNRSHDCYFSAEHAAKDSGIALTLAQGRGLAAPLAAATHQQYDRLIRLGRGQLDKSAVAELTFPGRLS